MPKIFVSYRRIDSQERAHRIADWLVLKYGRENVFIDVDTIGGGTDFIGSIEDSLAQSDVILIIIGDKWVDELNKRATQPDIDFVRLEVRTGLDRIPLVIPVLMNQNIDIRANQLLEDIRPMMRRNFRFARGGMDFHRDMEQIQRDIDKEFPVIVPPPAPEDDRKIPFIPILIVFAVIGAIVLFGVLSNPPDDSGTIVAEVTDEPKTAPSDKPSLEPTHTATDEPTATETEQPTSTPEPTDTPDIEAEALTVVAVQSTNQAIDNITATTIEHGNQTATATMWTDTPTPDVTASIDAKLTQWAGETATQSTIDSATQVALDLTATATLWTATPTATFTPSNTPTATPTFTPTLSPEQIAMTPIASNTDWIPIEQEFDGVTMVLVPVGNFTMGGDENEINNLIDICEPTLSNRCTVELFNDELPASNQEISKPFWISKFEITNKIFGSTSPVPIQASPNDFSDPNQPRVFLSWMAANDFCKSLGMRLPNEKEWEYASRGPDSLIYPWGNEWNDNIYPLKDENDIVQAPAIVGSYEEDTSWVGAIDMAGNVSEFTSSLYHNYPYDSTAQVNLGNQFEEITIRGGTHSSNRVFLRNSNRSKTPDQISMSMSWGFRCARDIDS